MSKDDSKDLEGTEVVHLGWPADEETWDGMEDYDLGREPDPTDEDALDWDDDDDWMLDEMDQD